MAFRYGLLGHRGWSGSLEGGGSRVERWAAGTPREGDRMGTGSGELGSVYEAEL